MASELLSLLIWASATLSVGILIVLALRVPVRRFADARVAYLLWLIPPLGFLAWLAPARQVTVRLAAAAVEAAEASGIGAATAAFDWPAVILVACWLIGLAGTIAVFRFRQRRFEVAAGLLEPVAALGRDVFSGAPTHGPAVVGALRPIIVLPSDFGSRFSPDEQALIIAHERSHLERGDPLVNVAALAARAVHWFNPLVHVAVRALRIDQELACDATVIESHGGARRTYAEAMLKSHASAVEVPLGCAWYTSAFHPMKERILMLRSSPSRLGRRLGLSFVACAALGAAGAVWLMRPVDVMAAATEEDALTAAEIEAMHQAAEDAREAVIVGRQAAREARAAMKEARLAAMAEARQALHEARAAVAAAQEAAAVDVRRAMKRAEPAIAAAREAAMTAGPAIAAAERALRQARPAIEAAHRAAATAAADEVRAVLANAERIEAQALARANARLDAACRRVLSRGSKSAEDDGLRSLEGLVCIAPVQDAPTVAPRD